MNRDDQAARPSSNRPVANPRRTRLAEAVSAAAGAPVVDGGDEVEPTSAA
jgi:hypothetical protein